MSRIEIALLSTISHRTEIHHRWLRLIEQASPTTSSTPMTAISVASPRRTRLAACS